MSEGVIPHGGFTLWKITPAEAANHPVGSQYAGLVRAPDGTVLGIHAYVVEVNGKLQFQGGVWVAQAVHEQPPEEVLYAQPIGVPPRPDKPPRPPRACAESTRGHSPPVSPSPQADLLAAPVHEFDDTTTFEGLPL